MGVCMIKVLFICLGNICRSAMSEAYMRHIVKNNNLENKISIISRATSSSNLGSPPYSGTQKILNKHKIDFSNIYSEKITKNDLETSDYIIVMDDSNMNNILKMNPSKKVHKLTDFIKNCEYSFIDDPYYTGDFDLAYELVSKGCDFLLNHIIQEHNLQK